MNLGGTGFFKLTKGAPDIDCYGAAWSPDGAKIAITSTDGIYVVNPNGTNVVNLTAHHTTPEESYPSSSPDGTKILYHTGDFLPGEIYIMNSDGSNPVNLTNHPAHDWRPYWIRMDSPTTSVSPQEKQITTWGQIKALTSGTSIALPIQSLDGQ